MIKKLPQNNRIAIFYVFAVLLVASIACGCGNKGTTQPPAVPTPQQNGQQPAKPVQKTISSSVKIASPQPGNQFDFSTKKDPFKPFAVVKAITAPTASEVKKALKDSLPIHSFDVSQFKLIGIISSTKDNQAMVVDPNGKGYVLKVGMSIGKNDGRITSINQNGVDVLEQFRDDNGRIRKENIRITLPRKQ